MPKLRSVLIVVGMLICGLIVSTTGAPRAIAGPTVTVENTVANPVGVVSADNPARNPFQMSVGGKPFNTAVLVFTVPAGQRLVVDFFSAEGVVPVGQTVSRFILGVQPPSASLGTVTFDHVVGPTSNGPSEGNGRVYRISADAAVCRSGSGASR